MSIFSRSIKFNLVAFIERLDKSLQPYEFEDDDAETTDEIVESYKNMLKTLTPEVQEKVKIYVNSYPLVIENQRLREFIEFCHR